MQQGPFPAAQLRQGQHALVQLLRGADIQQRNGTHALLAPENLQRKKGSPELHRIRMSIGCPPDTDTYATVLRAYLSTHTWK